MISQYSQTSIYDKHSLKDRLKKDSELALQLESQGNPHDLSQPFLGFIRQHEKIYAREIGLMKILIREFKCLYEIISSKVLIAYKLTSSSSNGQLHDILKYINSKINSHCWIFDMNFYVRQLSRTNFDPIDVSCQNRIIESYKIAYNDSIDLGVGKYFQ